MSVGSNSRIGFTRRNFLKVAAASGLAASFAGGALSACSPNDGKDSEDQVQTSSDQIYAGVCRGFCASGCPLNVHVREGKIVRTTAADLPNNAYKRICMKGLTHVHRVYSPNRIQYPLRRIGERGSGEFERISWDEAIQEIADKWQGIMSESGNSAIGVYAQTGNMGYLGGAVGGSVLARFKQAFGLTTVDGVFDRAARFAIHRMLGTTSFDTQNEMTDLTNAKTLLVWGAHPAVAQPQQAHFISEARDSGTKVIYIDPVFSQSAILADEWVPIRVGSDGALAMGMLNVIVEKGWQDIDFLKKNSVAPFLVKAEDKKFLRLSDLGKAEAGSEDDIPVVMAVDGVVDVFQNVEDPLIEVEAEVEGFQVTSAYSLLLDRIAEYPVEKAAELTGISAEKIAELAEQFACETPSSIYTVYGADHYYNGHWNYSCMCALSIVTGNLGRAGSFIGSFGIAGTWFVNLTGALDVESPETPAKKINIPRMPEVVNDHIYNGEPFDLRSIYITCANPAINIGNRQNVLDWMSKIEFIVVADMVMTETCQWADVVLPACHWFEYEDAMSQSICHPHIIYQEKILEPAYESKPDFEIYKMLASAMGRGDDFDFNEQEYLQMLLDTDAARELGITYDNLKEQKAIRFVPEGDYISYEGGKFNTDTGRAQFYIESPVASNDYPDGWDFEKEYLPYWEPPREAWAGSELQKKYPYQLMSEKSKYRTHSQWWDVDLMRELDPEPYVNLSVEDAQANGIAQGDTVKLFNDRGYVIIKANVVANLPQGVILIPKGWSRQHFIDGHYSDLTSEVMNGFCGNQPFFDVVVGLEKM